MTQNVKALDKIISKSKHIGQKVARSKCRNVIICVLYPEASLSSIQFYLLSSKDSCSLMSNVSIAEYAMLYSLYVGGEVRELSLVPLFYASLGYVEQVPFCVMPGYRVRCCLKTISAATNE